MLKTLLYICINIFGVIAFVWKFVIRCKLNMKGTMRYLSGIAGQSGYGSKSTADQVTQDCSLLHPNLTAIVTGNFLIILFCQISLRCYSSSSSLPLILFMNMLQILYVRLEYRNSCVIYFF